MALDKLVDSTQLDSDLTSVANAIRTRGGTAASLSFPSGFVTAIGNIPSGGITPHGTKTINVSSSGTITQDVTDYASVDVIVPAYSGGHHTLVTGYTVTVYLTNPVNAGQFTGCVITEVLDDQDTVNSYGDTLGNIASASGNVTVTVPTSSYGILVSPDGTSVDVPTSGISCTGDVAYVGGSRILGGFMFEVTGDGTVTFDGIDYDD